MSRRYRRTLDRKAIEWRDGRARDYDEWYRTGLGRLCFEMESAAVFELAGIKPGETVMDLGCGTGMFSLEAARHGARTIGVDSSPEMLAIAGLKAERSDLPVSFLRSDAENLPFASESLDLVLAVASLCFVSRPGAVLREAFRVIKPGGRLVAGELNRNSYWAWLRRIKGIIRETSYRRARFLSYAELEALLARAGFQTRTGRSLLFFPPVDSEAILSQSRRFEALGKRLVPRGGAFMAIRADKIIKPDKALNQKV